MEPYDEAKYDPYADPDIEDTLETSSRKKVDKWLRYERDNIHLMNDLHNYPGFLVDLWSKRFQENQAPYLTPDERETFSKYWSTMLQRPSPYDILFLKTSKHRSYAIHPLQSDDRLFNPRCNFPVGIAYGDRDFHGSDNGADEII